MESIALAALGLGAIGGVLTLALKALASERRAGEQKARADALDINLTGLAAQLADTNSLRLQEKQRADRLDDAYAQLLSEMAARGATGSYAVLLQIIAAAKANGGDGARGVHSPIGTDGGADTRLLKPGE